ncbi:hypothetical protein ACFOGI_11215 [Virgibacillus xinjiangensis]|uniref:Uncharacterized protein n=1 Tax=Virgibacillus xinjiangensis TaxID=393090 RepID=A0ABV7CWX0_9BACI
MNHELEEYVDRIVKQTDCSKSEQEELYEEMVMHVCMIRDEQLSHGKSMEEATQYAMEAFGSEAFIGDQLQQAIFPFRKELLLSLALLGFLFTIGQYLTFLIQEKIALTHMLSGMVGHSLVLFFALNRSFSISRKIWLSLALLMNLLLLLGNYAITPVIAGNHIFWMLCLVSMILLNLYLLYRTALTYQTDSRNKTSRRIIHTVNITLGLMTGLPSLYMYLLMMGFGAPSAVLLQFFVPLAVWLLVYAAQVFFVRRYPKSALGGLVLSVCLLAVIWMPWLAIYLPFDYSIPWLHQ